MRFTRKLNTLFWWIISLLPLLLAALYCLKDGTQTDTFAAYLSSVLSTLPTDSNLITSSLKEVLGYFGWDTVDTATSLFCSYMGYYVVVEILHIAVSVLTFLPMFCHRAFHRLLGNDDA